MMKIKIEGIEITYKSVLDLNEKLRGFLLKTKKEREECETKFRGFQRRERALKKFLGEKEETTNASGVTRRNDSVLKLDGDLK